jgi:hypothetical protein
MILLYKCGVSDRFKVGLFSSISAFVVGDGDVILTSYLDCKSLLCLVNFQPLNWLVCKRE